MAAKKQIWYSRTYRTLQADYKSAILFTVLLVIPCLVVLVTHLDVITRAMSTLAQQLISAELTDKRIEVEQTQYVPFGEISIVGFDCAIPTPHEIVVNLIVSFAAIVIMVISSFRGRPLMIYLLFSFMVHIISCVFFAFERDSVVYTGTEYSDLIVKQQVGIWILFIVLMGTVLALYSGRGLIHKIVTFMGVMLWAVFIGVMRYIVTVYLLARFSALYMADMYFVAGPVYDFLYLVGIYSIYSDRMQKLFDSPDGEHEWKWL